MRWPNVLKPVKPKSFPLATLTTILGILIFVGLFPGRLVTDSVTNIYYGLLGTYSLKHPPVIEALFGLIFVFDKSLTTIFVLQVGTYWLAVYLLAKSLSKNGLIYALLVILIAVFPYNLYLHSTLIKDVWLQSNYLLFFAIFSFALVKPKLDIALILALFFSAMSVILLRNGFIAVIPPLALAFSISCIKIKSHWNTRNHLLVIVASTIFMSLFMWAVAQSFNSIVTQGKAKSSEYHLKSLASIDLIGISAANNHTGVTKSLDSSAREKLTKAYNGNWVFWRGIVGDKTVDLKTQLTGEKDIINRWKSEIFENPAHYAQHRWHTFRKLFDGTGQSHVTEIKISRNLGPVRFHKVIEEVEIKQIRENVIWSMYSRYIKNYFALFPSTWWILVLSVAMLTSGLAVFFKSKVFPANLTVCLIMNLAAWSYFSPYILMLSHSEVRYVYPGLSLILFSLAFFVSFLRGALLTDRAV